MATKQLPHLAWLCPPSPPPLSCISDDSHNSTTTAITAQLTGKLRCESLGYDYGFALVLHSRLLFLIIRIVQFRKNVALEII